MRDAGVLGLGLVVVCSTSGAGNGSNVRLSVLPLSKMSHHVRVLAVAVAIGGVSIDSTGGIDNADSVGVIAAAATVGGGVGNDGAVAAAAVGVGVDDVVVETRGWRGASEGSNVVAAKGLC